MNPDMQRDFQIFISVPFKCKESSSFLVVWFPNNNSESLTQEIPKNMVSYLKATSSFDISLIDF